MELPNGDQAIVEDAKLLDYLLSDTHPRGKHKARVFAAAMGITVNEAGLLKAALLAARDGDGSPGRRNPFGQLYEIRYPCTGPAGTADVLSVCIVEDRDPVPRLVTAYVV